jgi:hypothetical protein
MLLACQMVAEHFKAHKAQIIAQRATWADPFIAGFEARIKAATEQYLGLDAKKDQKSATLAVTGLQEAALRDLSLLKVQVEEDFATDKPRRTVLLDTLGFASFWSAARQKDYQALLQLLYQYRTGLSKSIKAEITAKGADKALLERIAGYADTLKQANIAQETHKVSSKDVTEAGTVEFNAIYEQAMSICRICTRIFADAPQVKEKFVFSRLVRNMNGYARTASSIAAPVAPVQ